MLRRKYRFEFPIGLSFFKRFKLKGLCRNVNLDVPGYRSFTSLANMVKKEYNLNVFLFLDSVSATFSFSYGRI